LPKLLLHFLNLHFTFNIEIDSIFLKALFIESVSPNDIGNAPAILTFKTLYEKELGNPSEQFLFPHINDEPRADLPFYFQKILSLFLARDL